MASMEGMAGDDTQLLDAIASAVEADAARPCGPYCLTCTLRSPMRLHIPASAARQVQGGP